MNICEKILDKKDINHYYFIFLNDNEVGIFVSYYEFNKVLSFIEDERLPNSSKSFSESIKELENLSASLGIDTSERNKKEVLSVRDTNVVFKNFEYVSRFKIVLHLLFILILIPVISALFVQIVCMFHGVLILRVSTIFFIYFLLISMLVFSISLFTPQFRKWKIENFQDRIIINNKKEILHSDIRKVYTYSCRVRKVVKRSLIIEYISNRKIKKAVFNLKYTNYDSEQRFLEIFRY